MNLASNTIIRICEVMARTGLSRSSIYEKMAKGQFPPSIKIGPRAVGWIETEIEAHNQACIEASRPGDSG